MLLYEPVISIENGKIRGTLNRTGGDNKTYYAFKGIPYAKPPLGALRFNDPVKTDNWSGVLDATKDKQVCIQDRVGSEDCLYINIYTPSLSEKQIPVLVFIYGGSFDSGGSAYYMYRPDYFLDQGIIFVSFNYRLGVFGSLSTEDLTCPGNWALKDQLLALQWLQENIAYFGGDQEKVTVHGESAGAASISYLLETPLSKGLFRAAILSSGSSLNSWALRKHPRELAFKIGQALDINATNSLELIEDLRKVNSKKLRDVSSKVAEEACLPSPLTVIPFAPVKEPYHKNAVFYSKSYLLHSTGNFNRIPILIGVNSNEAGITSFQEVSSPIKSLFINSEVNSKLLTPVDLTSNDYQRMEAGKLIKLHYFGNSSIILNGEGISQFISDEQMVRGAREEALLLSKYVNVYFYVFSYEGELGILSHNRTFKGTSHAEELYYLFRIYPKFKVSKSDVLTHQRLVKLWTNFVKFSNPTPTKEKLLQNKEWATVSPDRSNMVYLDIGKDLEQRTNPFKVNMEFFDFIYKKFGSPPYGTY